MDTPRAQLNRLKTEISDITFQLLPTITKAFSAILKPLRDAVVAIKEFALALSESEQKVYDLNDALDQLIASKLPFWDGLVEKVNSASNAIDDLASRVFDFNDGEDGIIKIALNSAFTTGAVGLLSDILDTITDLIAWSNEDWANIFETGGDLILAAISGTMSAFANVIKKVLSNVASAFSSFVSFVANQLSFLVQKLVGFATVANDSFIGFAIPDGAISSLHSLNAGLQSAAIGAQNLSFVHSDLSAEYKRNTDAQWDKVKVAKEAFDASRNLAKANHEERVAASQLGAAARNAIQPQEKFNFSVQQATKSFDAGSLTAQQYVDTIVRYRNEFDTLTDRMKEVEGGVKNVDKATKGAGGSAKKAAKDVDKLNKAAEELAKNFTSLENELDPALAALREYRADAQLLAQALTAGLIPSQERFNELLDLAKAKYEEATERLTDDNDAKTFESIWTGAMEEIGSDIQDKLADSFEDLFNGQLDNARDFFDELKNIFTRSLAQLAAAVVQQNIVIPIGATITGNGSGGGLTGNPNTNIFSGGGLTGNPNTNIFGTLGQLGQAGNIVKAGASFLGLGGTATGAAAALGAPGSATALTAAMGTGSFAAGSAASGIGGAISGAMSAIGAAMPIIGGITAILGATGLLDGLFGGEQKPKIWGEVHGGQIGASYRAVDGSTMSQVNQALDEINTSLMETAQALGPAAMEALQNYTLWKSPGTRMEGDPGAWIQSQADAIVKDMIIATMDAAVEEANEIGVAYGALASQARELAGEDIDAFVQRLAEIDQTLTQLSIGINAIQPGAGDNVEILAQHVLALGENAAAASVGLVQLSEYMRTLETDQETLARLQPQVESLFHGLGMTLPETEQGFKELVKALDLTTTNGIYAASELGKNAQLIRDYYAASSVTAEQTDTARLAEERLAEARAQMAAITNERLGLEKQLLSLQGDTAEIRRREAAELYKSNQMLQWQIWATEDRQKAEEAATRAAEQASSARASAYQSMLNDQISALRSLVQSLQSMADAIASTIENLERDMLRSSTGSDAMSRTIALTNIQSMLLSARNGDMPNSDALNSAMGALQFDPSEFGTRGEFVLAQAQAIQPLRELQGLITDQATIEEQMLAAMERQISATQSAGSSITQSVDKLEPILNQMYPSIRDMADDIVSRMDQIDLNVDGMVSFEEFSTFFGPLATDEELAEWFAKLDANGNSILTEAELINLSLSPLANLATDIADNFRAIDLNVDGTVSYDEFAGFFGNLATATQMAAWFSILDANGDEMVSQQELTNINLANLGPMIAQEISAVDLNVDGMVSFEEFAAFFGPLATDSQLASSFQSLDQNLDGVLSQLELQYQSLDTMRMDIVASLGNIDTNTDGSVSAAEFAAFFAPLATDQELAQWFSKLDANDDGLLSEQELTTGHLNAMDPNIAYLNAINEGIWGLNSINNYLLSHANAQTSNQNMMVDQLSSIVQAAWSINGYASRMVAGNGFATGGIATGPTSGYRPLLHGREAVIPLGDGNVVKAPIQIPNLIAAEAGDSEELQAAISELQQEIAALRYDQQRQHNASYRTQREMLRIEEKREAIGMPTERS
jgi:Ca2+-binding EF-hand superfamily protein